jgi:hypothetical protein
MDYADLVIQLTPGDGDGYKVWVSASPAGESPPEAFTVPVTGEEIDRLAADFGRLAAARNRGRDLAQAGERQVDAELTGLGRRLFAALFPETPLKLYQWCRGYLEREPERGLRLRLQMGLGHSQMARLHTMPWEYLCEDGLFLAINLRTSIVRHLPLGIPASRPPVPASLSILLVSCEDPVLDLAAERHAIAQALSGAGNVRIKPLVNVTLDELRGELLAADHHIVHFMGHGGFDKAAGEGAVTFRDEAGCSVRVSGTEVAEQLADRSSVRLVVLNACWTACASSAGPYAGVATALLKAGIPAVVAMQFPISDRAALTFSRKLYSRLAAGDTLDAAVTEGRKAIRGQHRGSVEWGTPVLFQRQEKSIVIAQRQETRRGLLRSRQLASVPGSMPSLFVSFASEQVQWKDHVLEALQPLQSSGLLQVWQGAGMPTGVEWEEEIYRNLRSADAFLVLASELYTAPGFARDHEFPRIRERVEQGQAQLFWLPLDRYASAPPPPGDTVLAFLQKRQTAHDEHAALEDMVAAPNRTGLQDALFRTQIRVRRWLEAAPATPAAAAARAAAALTAEEVRRCEKSYLRDVARNLKDLPVGALGQPLQGGKLRSLPLEQVYVTLRADRTTLADRLETRALHQELAGAVAPEGRGDTIAKILAERGDRANRIDRGTEVEVTAPTGGLTLENAFRQERILVILGDPGSGKSVLCRWLALHLARAQLPQEPPYGPARVAAVALGPARLPILMRIGDLNAWLRAQVRSHGRAVVPDFVAALAEQARLQHEQGTTQVDPRQLEAVFQQAIEDQRAVVLVDGLDEVPDAGDRELITEMIEAFAVRHVVDTGSFVGRLLRRRTPPAAGGDPAAATSRGLGPGAPGETGGNQLVITSRVTGYDLAPLRLASEVAAHYLIRPLDDAQVEEFCNHVATIFDEAYPDEGLGRQLLDHLGASRLPGLDRLKRSPLLLTSLVCYWYPRRCLPENRAELFHAILIDLCAHWRTIDRIVNALSHSLRSWLDEDDKVLDLIGMIAEEIHREHPSGRIARGDLERMIGRLLPAVTGRRRLELDGEALRELDADVAGLTALIGTQAGALTEAGPGIFSFLHLAFQEYLVGRRLVRQLPRREPESTCVAAFLKHLGEPRWREPLLFAFGELGRGSATVVFDRQRFLAGLRTGGFAETAAGTAAVLPLFIADLVAELSPGDVGQAELGETLRALTEGYAACGLATTARRRRERIAERIAELRRSAVGATGQAIDRQACRLIASDPQLAGALSHLYWDRLWLTPAILDTMAAHLELDAPEWDWPMHSALRWCLLPPEDRLTIEPIARLEIPADEEGSSVSPVRRRYQVALEPWERLRRERNERVADPVFPEDRFALRQLLLANRGRWLRLMADPVAARVVTALLAPVADHRSVAWLHEYFRLAHFLEEPDASREEQVDRAPELFLTRWGVVDPIYECAKYLDTSPGGRFHLAGTRPVLLDPAQIARRLPPAIESLIDRCATARHPGERLREGLIEAQGSPDLAVSCHAALGLTALGRNQDRSRFAKAAGRRVLEAAVHGLKEPAFRALRQGMGAWLGRGDLDESECAVVLRHLTSASVAASGIPTYPPILQQGGGRLLVIEMAAIWADAVGGLAEDSLNKLRKCLQTCVPDSAGWTGPVTLLAAICRSGGTASLRAQGLLPSAPLWGVAPDERLVPPQCYEVLLQLALIASGKEAALGMALVEVFARHLPAHAAIDEQLVGARFTRFGDDDRQEEAVDLAGGAPATAQEGREPAFSPASAASLAMAGSGSSAPVLRAMRVEAALLGSPHAAPSSQVTEAASDLGRASPLDAALFLARVAMQIADTEIARDWLTRAMAWLDSVADAGVRAEALARLVTHIGHDPALRRRHAASAATLASPLLRAHAEGNLASFLAGQDFAWNDRKVQGTEPQWVMAAVFAALHAAGETAASEIDSEAIWRMLADAPDAARVRQLLGMARDRGLACSQAALDALATLRQDAVHRAPADAGLERLLPLLTRAPAATRPELERWILDRQEAAATRRASGPEELLARQAAILLAEARQVLEAEWLPLLFDTLEDGDDQQAVRAEIALAGPQRNVERQGRRFSASRQGVEILQHLAQRERDETGYRAYVDLCAISDWIFDAPDLLQAWCDRAAADSVAGEALVAVVHGCDLWSPRCQRVIGRWLAARSRPESGEPAFDLVEWVGRLSYVASARPVADLLDLLAIPEVLDRIGGLLVWPRDGKDVPRHDLVVEACAKASMRAIGAEAAEFAEQELRRLLTPLCPARAVDPTALKALGGNAYQPLGGRPETLWRAVGSHLDRASFRHTLADWFLQVIEDWRLTGRMDRTAARVARHLKLKLEAQLCFLMFLSYTNENAFARLCEPDRFLAPLAAICLRPPSTIAKLAAITLISRLKHVDLDLEVADPGTQRRHTVLDALLGGLRESTDVRERLLQAIPDIYQLRGAKIVERLAGVLLGTVDSTSEPRLYAGSEVLGAAEMLAQLIRRGSLHDPGPRRQALDLLRHAASLPVNERPLYRRAGLGGNGDPIRVAFAGGLANELQNLVDRL